MPRPRKNARPHPPIQFESSDGNTAASGRVISRPGCGVALESRVKNSAPREAASRHFGLAPERARNSLRDCWA